MKDKEWWRIKNTPTFSEMVRKTLLAGSAKIIQNLYEQTEEGLTNYEQLHDHNDGVIPGKRGDERQREVET